MKIKQEMIAITERLKEMYPGKHIDVTAHAILYGSSEKILFQYGLYVEDTIVHESFKTIAAMNAVIDTDDDPEETEDETVE